MYSSPFRYRRAASLREASGWLAANEEARALAGGQSLVPLMKLRLARPAMLVDLNFIPNLDFIRAESDGVHLGALARHAAVARSEAAGRIALLHDCAAGIADIQVRNCGTVGGSVAEADPSGDWPAALLALDTEVRCVGPDGARTVLLPDFLSDAFTTVLLPGELVSEVVVRPPDGRSGSAYVAFKRTAPVYATASAAVCLAVGPDGVCTEARIVLGCMALLPLRMTAAEAALRGQRLEETTLAAAAEAAMAAVDPPADSRGSKDYKRVLIRALVLRALRAAASRSRGERTEVSHEYVGR